MVYTDNSPLTYAYKGKLSTSQIRWLTELALFDFAMKYWTGKSNKAPDTLCYCTLNPDLLLESDTDSDKVDIISYLFPCDDANENDFKTISHALVWEIVNWHIGTTKIPNNLKEDVQAISCTVEPLLKEEEDFKTMAQLNIMKIFGQVMSVIMGREQCREPVLGLVCL